MITDDITNDDLINNLCRDIDALRALGLSDKDIKETLLRLPYVKKIRQNARIYRLTDKLPKGYKWKDAESYRRKGERGASSSKLQFLPIGNDLYMTYYFGRAKTAPIVIENYRDYTANEVLYEFAGGCYKELRENSEKWHEAAKERSLYKMAFKYSEPDSFPLEPPFIDFIREFWRKQGLKQGGMPSILRDW